MEPISTFNSGASLALQSKSFPLKDLAAKAKQLIGAQNNSKANGAQSLNMGPEASTTPNPFGNN